ncbi:cysteine-rich receptor-like protein kinase 25 [Typha latifolia]|uniref:cysteine-rich receptor-like protein kinase 25 n=1 Tax=Typha latifolia TaxID=4733 RepID=UPI003C2E12C2
MDAFYTANNAFRANLKSLFRTLLASDVRFSQVKVAGRDDDKVYGLTFCRGDLSDDQCRTCLKTSMQEILQQCSRDTTIADLYRNYCFLRYSYKDFYGYSESGDSSGAYSVENATEPQLFSDALGRLMGSLIKTAVNGSTTMFAAESVNYTSSNKIYGLMQCTGDITKDDCQRCLDNSSSEISTRYSGSVGVTQYATSCVIRYELFPFYNTTAVRKLSSPSLPTTPAAPVTPPPAEAASGSTGGKIKLWIIITITSLASLFSFSFLYFLWIKRQRLARQKKEKLHVGQQILGIKTDEENSLEFSLYDFSHIANATNHFSSENKLGEGGFGPVYKGQLPDGLEIAAKRLGARSGQGLVEFKNEIQVIAKLQHRNLVALLGYCIQGEEKILIYEYMPNKSLDFFLFDKSRGAMLDWGKRFRIIEGIAQGVLYLHEHSRLRIIHRDLKASNILLDRDMNPKISDFGMARIFGSNETQANTNRVVGTYGYMSPEYAFGGLFSIKSDVFSFGVLLLEIVSGKRNAGSHQYGNSLNLLGYTWELWEEGKWFELIDASLGDEYDKDEILKCINVALMCVQENAMDRPTMSDIITMLSGESTSLPDPKQPAFFNLRITTEVEKPSDLIETCSVNNVTITAPYGR